MPNADVTQTVRDFLSAMEQRDLPAAKAMLAPGFVMLFPGGARMTALEELVEWAAKRFRRARKTYERFDVAPGDDGASIVYCFGTLHGEALSGESYAGIRFIDRFTIAGGLIKDQMVWNDMAEMLGAPRAG
jgi:hypothetical protein